MIKKLQCYIYGIGMRYNLLSSYLRLYQDKLEILALVTTEPQRITQLDGKEVIRPWEMELDKLDYVIVAAEQYKEIFEILKGLGLSDKILRSDIFSIPNFDLMKYLKVRASRPSILANTCLGGFIYHDLGLRRLSPTIGSLCPDYIQFLKQYKKYLSMEMQEADRMYRMDEMISSNRPFAPKGTLDGTVCWRFIHADGKTSEVRKWNRRRLDVNFDHIIALMIIMTDEEAYEFDRLPIKRKLGFYYKDLGLKSVLYTPEWNDLSVVSDYYYGYAEFIHQFYARNKKGPGKIDWIRFLNGETEFLRF